MERFNALGRGAQLMLIGAVLLFIDMFFAWQSVDLPEPFGDYTRKGWYGAAGIILGLLTIVLLAWLIVRIASVNVPLPVSTAMTAALIGTLILIFAVIKLLSILGDESTFWAWIGLAFAIVIAVGAFQTVQEAGGVASLQQEAGAFTGSAGGAAAGTAGAAGAAPAAADDTAAEAAGAAQDAASGAMDTAADATSGAAGGGADSAMGAGEEAAGAASSAAEGGMDTAQDAMSGATEATGDAADAAADEASDLTDGPSTGAGA